MISILLELFQAFFKIGFFTVGGGYAMLPLIQQEIERYNWITSQEFIDIIAIAEMTPGAIAVNTATFVGFRSLGIIGSLVATTAIALPSLLIIVSLSQFWTRHQHHPLMIAFFSGIRPVVAGLIAGAAIYIAQAALLTHSFVGTQWGSIVDVRSVTIAVAVFVAVSRFKQNPIRMIATTAVLGLFIYAL